MASTSLELQLAKLANEGRGAEDKSRTLINRKHVADAIRHNKPVYVASSMDDYGFLSKLGLAATVLDDDFDPSCVDMFDGSDLVAVYPEDKGAFARLVKDTLEGHAFSFRFVCLSESLSDMTSERLAEQVSEAEPETPSYYISDRVNVGLFADSILERNHMFVYRDPSTGTDMIYWYKDGVYQYMPDNVVRSRIRKLLPSRVATPARIIATAQMIPMSKDIRRIDDFGELDSNEDIVNLKCGLYDIRKQQLLDHDPDEMSTIQLNITSVNERPSDRWISYVEDLCRDEFGEVDKEMMDLLQEWTGYILSSLKGKRIKRALVLHAAVGNSGKSVFINVLSSILGREHIVNTDLHKICSDRWGTGRAFGKRLIAIGDQDGKPITSSENFKFMTGGDGISAEKKGIQGFDYVFNGIFLIGSNFFPIFEDDKGTHVVERLLMLPCRHTVPEHDRDPELEDKLTKDANGIFTWGMEGLRRFLKNGMHFTECKSARDLTEDYRGRYDTVYYFIQQNCDLTLKTSDYIRKSDFWDAYVRFCQDDNLKPLLRKNLQQRVESYGITVTTLDGYKVLRGVKFTNFVEVHDRIPY